MRVNRVARLPNKIKLGTKSESHRECCEAQKTNKYIGMLGRPVLNNVLLFHVQVRFGPRKVGEKPVHLIVGIQIAGHELAETQRKRNGGHQ